MLVSSPDCPQLHGGVHNDHKSQILKRNTEGTKQNICFSNSPPFSTLFCKNLYVVIPSVLADNSMTRDTEKYMYVYGNHCMMTKRHVCV